MAEDKVHPYKIAFIIDGEVVETLLSHEHLGAILLSDPLIIDVSGNDEVMAGYKYNSETGEFYHD
jgi:hypothetical protein